MTLWSPDTCDCQIEYDDNAQYIRTTRVCRKHTGLAGQAHFDAVLSHNRAKNIAADKIAKLTGVNSADVVVTYDPAAPVDNDPLIIATPLTPKQTSDLKTQLGSVPIVVSK